jgi:hypothetical protein
MYDGEVISYPFLPPFISSTLKVDPSFYDKGECLSPAPPDGRNTRERRGATYRGELRGVA